MWRCSRGARPRIRHWLDRLLPPVCLVCGDPLGRRDGRVCGPCWARAPRLRRPLCPRCGISLRDTGPISIAARCTECLSWLPYLRAARAPFQMAGVAAEIVHTLKYGGWRELAGEMGLHMARVAFPASVEAEIDGVVPIPLAEARRRERGFNQSEELARAVSLHRGWPILTAALRRSRHTRRQARLSPRERWTNVMGAFEVQKNARPMIADAHLLLVDDVLTTGATALACVRVLVTAGARAVSVLTFARARPEPAGT